MKNGGLVGVSTVQTNSNSKELNRIIVKGARQAVTESNSPKFPPSSKYIKIQYQPPWCLFTGTENVINAEN